ncbi:PPC domain-containing DNA-binding protein [Schnuerera sp.]|uniref:PPC domain-containing DNA-binding protein n=1 Tax=Schnuerera sp. TaxID=2794844 RepID=UPI002C939949|nr:PPC domain-containing DNA-binding protein [Schnuerera sp.]HSH35512.1 PPC domain-containing DNA-binding protein [Schnuerera sp.]
MEFKKIGSKYVVRLEKGEEVVESIKALCEKEEIKLGTITGIGAVNKAVIGLFETSTKEYHSKELTGDMEITSLLGNISQMDGEVYLHLHITLADHNYNVHGGHLTSAVISATGEIIIDTIEGVVDREFDEEVGLNLFKF